MDVTPFVGGWGAVKLEYFEDLVDFRVAIEHGLFLNELRENTTDGPDVDAEAVLFLAEEDFGGPIPEGLNLMGKGLDGDAESTG